MARKCKNCGQETLTVRRNGPVWLRVICTNCGEINEQRDYTDEQEYHDERHKGGRNKEKYEP